MVLLRLPSWVEGMDTLPQYAARNVSDRDLEQKKAFTPGSGELKSILTTTLREKLGNPGV